MNLEIVLAMMVQPATMHRLLVANATSNTLCAEGEGLQIPEGNIKHLEVKLLGIQQVKKSAERRE
jgi:hypothetical protein